MKEMILLFNPPAKEQLLKIRSALLPLHIRIQLIKPEQYNQPLGYLAGMKGCCHTIMLTGYIKNSKFPFKGITAKCTLNIIK